MKHTMTLIGIGVAAVLFSSAALAQKAPLAKPVQEKKNTRHIKMMKIENGKKMELDTVLTGNDVFVWNGDTINPPKNLKHGEHAVAGMSNQFDVKVDSKNGAEKIMIFKHKDGEGNDPIIMKMGSDEDFEILTENVDSLGKKVVVRKRMKHGSPDRMIYFNDAEGMHFPPVPPPPPAPPVPHIKTLKMQHGGRVIDLNDPNILSYKKKSLSGDREKIEIIRKKSDGPELMNFNFNDEFEMPEAPEAPDHIMQFEGNGERMKVIKKDVKVDGKDAKEIKVEVESQENK